MAIVAASLLAGARILGSADDSIRVWATARDLAPGATIGQEDLVASSVRFGDPADLARYLVASEPLPSDTRLTRGLGEGELVPAGALRSGEEEDVVIVSLAFPPELVPTNIGAGSVIELLVIHDGDDASATGRAAQPTTVLSDVTVIDAPSQADSLGSVSRGRQLVLGVPDAESEALPEILAASEDQRVRVLVRS